MVLAIGVAILIHGQLVVDELLCGKEPGDCSDD